METNKQKNLSLYLCSKVSCCLPWWRPEPLCPPPGATGSTGWGLLPLSRASERESCSGKHDGQGQRQLQGSWAACGVQRARGGPGRGRLGSGGTWRRGCGSRPRVRNGSPGSGCRSVSLGLPGGAVPGEAVWRGPQHPLLPRAQRARREAASLGTPAREERSARLRGGRRAGGRAAEVGSRPSTPPARARLSPPGGGPGRRGAGAAGRPAPRCPARGDGSAPRPLAPSRRRSCRADMHRRRPGAPRGLAPAPGP